MRTAARLCLILALAAAAAWPVDWKALKPQGYVSDFAGVIDAQSRAELESYATRVEQQTGAEMAFVTVRSLEGEPVEDVANTIYRAWGVGKKGKDEGILLLLSISDRRSRLEVGYGLEPILPDGFAGEVLRNMRPALRESHYGEAMRAAAETIGQRVAAEKGVALDTTIRRQIRPQPVEQIPWPLIVAGIVFLLLMSRGGGGRGRGYRGGGPGGFLTGMILGSMMGRRSGGWSGGSHGGFGGYDSGGGFGGFGGGDSGGGGASSNW
jgi:uncharacterized protein